MADPYDRTVGEQLHQARIIYLAGDITNDVAAAVVSRLLVLDSIEKDAEIKLYISSFGGSVYAGLAIYDAMQLIEAPVSTFCIGAAFSMAAWLLAAGAPGRRFATPNSRVMLHQVSAGFSGTSPDVKIAAENILHGEARMVELLVRHTGKSADDVRRAIERDLWLAPEQAVAFGLIDRVTTPAAKKACLEEMVAR